MPKYSLGKLGSPSEIRQFIISERERLMNRRSLNGIVFMHEHSDLMDAAISQILHQAWVETAAEVGDRISPHILESVSLAATGGYGRRELCPFSDIDITFIVDDQDDAQIDLLVKNVYRLLMDVFLNGTGLKVGYSYRYIDDIENLPLDTHTALLDARRVSGGALLFDRFYSGILRAISPAEFVFGHLEQRAIIGKQWGASPYLVEANIKEGVGGLRDLQTARWIAQVAFGTSRSDVWLALRAQGIISDEEIKWIEDAAEFLAKVRNKLHIACGRDTDILYIDRQDEISAVLGYKRRASTLMANYFMHAEHIAGIYRKVASACHDQPLEIEPGLVVQRKEIRLLDGGLLSRDPEVIIRIFEHAMMLGLGLCRETADSLRGYVASSRPPHLKKTGARIAKAFLRVLGQPHAAQAIDSMSSVGAIQWLIPEFGRIMHLIPGDSAHELTVGAHSLEAVHQMESFAGGPDGELRDIFSGVRNTEVLFLATLLHDIGKADKEGPHAESGAVVAASIAHRLGLRSEAATQLVFLIRNHLLMSEVARLRDLTQKRTVQDFISVVDSLEMLDMLYLLTVADTRSVGQTTWSEVQISFLRELYHRADVALRGQVPAHFDIEKHRGRIVRELSLSNLSSDEINEHCRAMPARYQLNTSPDDLASHIIYVRSARDGKPVVNLKDDPMGLYTEITICTLDDPAPGLLYKMAFILSALDVDIHAAQVFTRESYDRIAIDILYVDFDHRSLPELKRLQVQSELEQMLAGGTNLDSMLKRFGKKLKVGIELANFTMMSNLSDQHTVIEIDAEDQPGLLYRLTKAISLLGWDIHSAKVSTWGSRARDSFYVTDSKGAKLDSAAADALRKAIKSH